MLRPVAAKLDVPRPSYSTVRRICISERERKRRKQDELDWLIGDLLAGRVPLVYVEHKLMNLGPPPRRFRRRPRRAPRAS
jgi:hypothetical protein